MKLNALTRPVQRAVQHVAKDLRSAERAVQRATEDVFESVRGIGKTVYRTDDAKFDGAFVGAKGEVFPPGTPLSSLPAAVPTKGVSQSTTFVYVNGMGIERDRQAKELQLIADQTGARVVGLHNGTSGWAGDFPQALGDKLDQGRNPAVDALEKLVLQELDAGRPVHLLAHSHGALITSRALTHVRRMLEARGLSPSAVNAKLGKVQVETFGGAASSYPDGPRYVHYVNRADIQSAIYGMGPDGDPRRRNAGAGAQFRSFSAPALSPVVTHDFPGTYLPHRAAFQ